MKDFEKEPFEDLTDEQLDELLAVMNQSMTDKNQEAIRRNVHQKLSHQSTRKVTAITTKKKRKWKYILGVAALLSLLVGFTNRDAIKLAYLKAFGTESEKLLLNADKLNESAEDNGLKLTAKSSFKDGDTTYVLMTLQDLTGDRLSRDMDIYNWTMLNGGNTQVVDYDETSKTATLLTTAISWENRENKGFQLNTFLSHEKKIENITEINWENAIQANPKWKELSQEEGFGGGADTEALKKLNIKFEDLVKTYLEPKVLHISLDDEKTAYVENIAYKDGLLHILYKRSNKLNRNGDFLSLVSKKDGKIVDLIADYQVVRETHSNETGMTDYEEVVFNIPESEIENYDIKLEGTEYKNVVKGNWSIKLKEPTELETKDLGKVQIEDNIELKNIILSGLSLNFEYDPQTVKEELPVEISIVKKDGTEQNISKESVFLYPPFPGNPEGELLPWTITFNYIPLDTIDKVKFNGEIINVK